MSLLEVPHLDGLQPYDIKRIIKGCVFRNYNLIYDQYNNILHLETKVLDRKDDEKHKREDEERRMARWRQQVWREDSERNYMASREPWNEPIGFSDRLIQFPALSELKSANSVPSNLTESQLVAWVFYVVACAEAHEMCENFYYEGERVFDPHSDNRVEKSMILPFFYQMEPFLGKKSKKSEKEPVFA